MRKTLLGFIGCEVGGIAVEYAMIGLLVSIACVAGSRVIGGEVNGLLGGVMPGLAP